MNFTLLPRFRRLESYVLKVLTRKLVVRHFEKIHYVLLKKEKLHFRVGLTLLFGIHEHGNDAVYTQCSTNVNCDLRGWMQL